MITFVFGSGTERQISLAQYALHRFNYPVQDLTAVVTFQFVDEPSAEGHNDFACTVTTGPGTYTIEVRNDLDTMGRDPEGLYEGEQFFVETIIHEMGHVIIALRITTIGLRGEVCACFRRKAEEGYPGAVGTTANWSSGAWEEHIEEATAETIKDAWLSSLERAFENRTHWQATEEKWEDLTTLLLPPQGDVEVYSTGVPLMHPGPPNWSPVEQGWQQDAPIQHGPDIIVSDLWAWLGTQIYSTSIGMNRTLYQTRRALGEGKIRVDADFTQEPWEFPTFDYPAYGSKQSKTWVEATEMAGGWVDGQRIINQYVPPDEVGITFGLYMYEEFVGGGGSTPTALWKWRMEYGVPIILGADIDIPDWDEAGYLVTSVARFYVLVEANGPLWTPHPGEPAEERVLPSRPGAPARWWQERQFKIYMTAPVSYSTPPYPYLPNVPQASPARALLVRRSWP